MRFNIPAFGLTVGLLWSIALLVVASANVVWPSYGGAFLDVMASVYPGYDTGTGAGSVVTAALYGFVDGGIGGVVFAWVYNLLAGRIGATVP